MNNRQRDGRGGEIKGDLVEVEEKKKRRRRRTRLMMMMAAVVVGEKRWRERGRDGGVNFGGGRDRKRRWMEGERRGPALHESDASPTSLSWFRFQLGRSNGRLCPRSGKKNDEGDED